MTTFAQVTRGFEKHAGIVPSILLCLRDQAVSGNEAPPPDVDSIGMQSCSP